jgi:hypothetical protein
MKNFFYMSTINRLFSIINYKYIYIFIIFGIYIYTYFNLLNKYNELKSK